MIELFSGPVIHISPTLPPAIGGVGDYASLLAAEMGRRGMESRFLAGVHGSGLQYSGGGASRLVGRDAAGVLDVLLNEKRREITRLEDFYNCGVHITVDSKVEIEAIRVTACLENEEKVVIN